MNSPGSDNNIQVAPVAVQAVLALVGQVGQRSGTWPGSLGAKSILSRSLESQASLGIVGYTSSLPRTNSVLDNPGRWLHCRTAGPYTACLGG